MGGSLFLFLIPLLGLAEPLPSPTPSPSDNLPAYEVAILRGADPLRTGDALVLKIPGLDPKLEFAAEISTDDGWFVEALPALEPDQKEFRFKATPIKPGKITLPTLPLKDTRGQTVARTSPLTLTVQSSIDASDQTPTEPAPLLPPVGLPFPFWILIAAGLLILGLTIAVLLLLKRLIKPKPLKPVEAPKSPPLPEDEEALRALTQLEGHDFLRRGEFKPHYFALSEIFKTYAGRRYHFDALECTSPELLAFLQNKGSVTEKLIDQTAEIFKKLDLVKFTDHVPPPTEGLELLKNIREIVLTTRRPPEPKTLSEDRK